MSRPSLLKVLGLIYHDIGFDNIAEKYYKEALELDRDSADYYSNLASIEFSNENFENAILFAERAYKIDSAKIPDIVYLLILLNRIRKHICLPRKKLIN